MTVAILRELETRLPPGLVRRRMAAVTPDGSVAGFGTAMRHACMPEGRFEIAVSVAPPQRRQGAGTLLYDDALAFAVDQGAFSLVSEVRDSEPAGREFAEHRGFSEDRHIFESTLDFAGFDERRFAGVVDAVAATGIRFFSLADAGDTEAMRRRLYAIDRATTLDVPGFEGDYPTFEEFDRLICNAVWFRPDTQLIAADGDRWVGLASLHLFTETRCMYNEGTGVDREYRGRHIALALKLRSIEVARRCGAAYMRTHNDSQNASMLAINRRLGYLPKPGFFRMLAETTGG